MKLLIVESPAKAKTISKYLNGEYTVVASVGHIRDLPKSNKQAIDIDGGFIPHYEISKGKEKVVSEIKSLSKKASEILLATDPDREGEAIAWHIAELIEDKSGKSKAESLKSKVKRVSYVEITEEAIREALGHPREIDQNLRQAQEARRVLDRLVGYDLSGLIWKKVRYGLSAGRVQSPALRIIMEREREIRAFKSHTFWVISADVSTAKKNNMTLVCEVEPNGEDTDVWFEWSDDEDEVDDGDGEETNTVDVDGNDSSDIVRVTITGLDEDTDYFFKCFADNNDGDDESGIEEFTTDENGGGGDEPDVTTLSATGITTASAVIRGEVDPNGEETDVWFEWGTSSTNLNRETSTEDAGDGTNDVDFDRTITGLSANTTYFYRAVAESNEGIDRGNILSFRTNTVAPPTVLTQFIERIVEREPEPEPEGLIITLDVDTTNIDSDEIRYTVSYENLTDETFTNAELIVEIPDELEFIDADPTEDDEDGNDLFFTIGTISPGEEDSFVIDTEVQNNVDDNDEIL